MEVVIMACLTSDCDLDGEALVLVVMGEDAMVLPELGFDEGEARSHWCCSLLKLSLRIWSEMLLEPCMTDLER